MAECSAVSTGRSLSDMAKNEAYFSYSLALPGGLEPPSYGFLVNSMSGLSCALEPKIVAASFNEIHAGMELF